MVTTPADPQQRMSYAASATRYWHTIARSTDDVVGGRAARSGPDLPVIALAGIWTWAWLAAVRDLARAVERRRHPGGGG